MLLLAIEDDGLDPVATTDCCGKGEELTGDEAADDDDEAKENVDAFADADDVRWRLESSRAVRKLRMVTSWCLHWIMR